MEVKGTTIMLGIGGMLLLIIAAAVATLNY